MNKIEKNNKMKNTTEIEMSSYPNTDKIRRVIRLKPSEKLLKTSISHIKQKITADLESEFKSIKERSQHLANIAAPMRTLIEQNPRAVASLDALQKLAKEEQQQWAEIFKERAAWEPTRTFSFTANPGFQIIAPPYDLEWQVGPLFVHKDTGKMNVFNVNGESAAAVGVFLSSPVRSLVRVAPYAPFDFQWSGFSLGAPASTKGSVGVIVYDYGNDDPLPAYDYRAVIWNVQFGITPRDKGSGFSDVSGALLRDVLITMEPGNWYLVWVWCAVLAHSALVEGIASFAGGGINCSVPFIFVEAGPVPNVR